MSVETSKTSRPSLRCDGWVEIGKKTLRGKVSVTLPNGLTINEVTIHNLNGKTWASLPSKPMIGRDGQQMVDAKTGKPRYVPLMSWPDRATSDRFSEAVISAVEALHPG